LNQKKAEVEKMKEKFNLNKTKTKTTKFSLDHTERRIEELEFIIKNNEIKA